MIIILISYLTKASHYSQVVITSKNSAVEKVAFMQFEYKVN